MRRMSKNAAKSSENKGMSILSGEASKSTFDLDSRDTYKDNNIDEKMNYFHMCVMGKRINIKEMEYTNRFQNKRGNDYITVNIHSCVI